MTPTETQQRRQKALKKAATHLLRQWEKAIGGVGRVCVYRAPDGLKCAIGALISDARYSPSMEGHDVGPTIMRAAELAVTGEYITEEDIRFARALQSVHDNFAPTDWPLLLGELAHEYALDTSGIPGL